MTTGTVEFLIPPDFVEFRPAHDLEEAYEALAQRLGPATADIPPERRQAITDLYARTSTAMTAAGAIWSGSCAGTIGGHLSTATLTLTEITTGDDTDQHSVAAALRNLLTPPSPSEGSPSDRLVQHLDAPAGPVVVTVEQGPSLRMAFVDDQVPTLSAKVYLPMTPNLQGVLVVELTTPDIDHWPEIYAPLLVQVVRSIRLPEPAATTPPAEPRTQPPITAPAGTGDPFATVLHP
ncbi:hypothetical protein [Kitasatospora herbaricolor]|uniref:hypothetical protein n=1 Tax=Kitasatospora herbaricolor TaxID=68217 RepID=UPI0036D76522